MKIINNMVYFDVMQRAVDKVQYLLLNAFFEYAENRQFFVFENRKWIGETARMIRPSWIAPILNGDDILPPFYYSV